MLRRIIILILIMFLLPLNSVLAISNDKSQFMGDHLFGGPMKFIEPEKEQSSEFIDMKEDYSPLGESILRRSSTTPPLKKLRLKIAKNRYKKLQQENKEKNKVINQDITNEIDFDENLPDISEDDTNLQKEQLNQLEQTEKDEQAVKKNPPAQNVIISCDNMDYYHSTAIMNADGNVVVDFVNQDAQIKATHLDYRYNENIMIATGDVKIIKGTQEILGDYIKIDLNTENIIMDNPSTHTYKIDINAKQAYMHGNDIIQDEGTVEITDDFPIDIRPSGRLRYLRDLMVNEKDKVYLTKKIEKDDLKIKVEKLTIDAKKEHNVLYLKNAEFFLKDKRVLKIPRIRFCTNKNFDYIEGNYPEIGSRQDVGTFLGPGWAFTLPKGSTLKVAPLFVIKDKPGVGGLAKLKNGSNETELYYGTSQSLWVLRGKQKLDDNLYLQYGLNHYLDDWFLGRQKPKYGIDLVYGRAYQSQNFLNKKLIANMTTRSDLGFYKDAYGDHHFDKLQGNETSTFRARTMLEGYLSLYSYQNPDELKLASLLLVSQGSAALYGTGDTQIIGRVGPLLRTQYKRWMQDIGYFQSVYNDDTPMPVYDKYRYGRSNVYAREYVRICKYLTMSVMGAYNLSDDYYSKNRISEFALFASIGPDDLRLDIGYDFVRENAYIGIQAAMNAKGTKMDFDKMVLKNPENMKQNKENDTLYSEADSLAPEKPLQYAQIVDIGEYDNEL